MDNFEFDIDKALNDLEKQETHQDESPAQQTTQAAETSDENVDQQVLTGKVPDLLGDLKEPIEQNDSGKLKAEEKDIEPSESANPPAISQVELPLTTNQVASNDDNEEMEELMKSLQVDQHDLYKKELQKELEEKERQEPSQQQLVTESNEQAESNKSDEVRLDQTDTLTKSSLVDTSTHADDDSNAHQPEPEAAQQINEDEFSPFSDPFERLAKLDNDSNQNENAQGTPAITGNLVDVLDAQTEEPQPEQESNKHEDSSNPPDEEASRPNTSEKLDDRPVTTSETIPDHPVHQSTSSAAGEEFNPFTCPSDFPAETREPIKTHAPLKPMLSDDDGNPFVDTHDTLTEMAGPATTTNKPINPAITKIASIESHDETFYSGNDDSECFFDTVENPLGSTSELATVANPLKPQIPEPVEPADEQKDTTPVESNQEPEVREAVSSSVQELDKIPSQADSSREPPPDIAQEQPEATIPIDLDDNVALETAAASPAVAHELDEANREVVTTEAFVNEILSINEHHLHATTGVFFDQKEAEEKAGGEGSLSETTGATGGRVAVIQVIDFETEWSQLSEREKTLGLVAPIWLADKESDVCMKCGLKFTFSRRRHHCRACGRLFCSNCCHLKMALPYQTIKGVAVSAAPGSRISEDFSTSATDDLSFSRTTDADASATASQVVSPFSKEVLSRICNDCHDTIKKVNELRLNKAQSKRTVPTVSALKKRPATVTGSSSTFDQAANGGAISEVVDVSSGSKVVRSKSVRFYDGSVPGGSDLTENPRQAPPTRPPLQPSTSSQDEAPTNETNPTAPQESASQVPVSDINESSSSLPDLEASQTPTTTTTTNESSKSSSSSKKKDNKSSSKSKSSSSYLLTKKYKISNKHVYRQNRLIEEELISRIKVHYIANDYLPPILVEDAVIDATNGDFDEEKLIKDRFTDASQGSNLVTFLLLRNLKVFLRLINFDCCSKCPCPCWVFTTSGLCMNGQEELVFVIKCLLDENGVAVAETGFAKQILYHVMDIFERTLRGHRIRPMSHVLYDFEIKNKLAHKSSKSSQDQADGRSTDNGLLGSKENIGFLYFQSSVSRSCCLDKMRSHLPTTGFLVGHLIQKWEIPWAKLFPLRLFLRLAAESNTCYPVISDRNRKSVYGDIGQTIMSLLCDVRNFQYTIAQISGLFIRVEGQSARISIPESQYDLIVKSMLTSNDYVFSLASLELDDSCPSHLVAIENENLGSYSSKVINFDSDSSINNTVADNSISLPRSKSTGAAFVVFNGAMKTNLAMNAKLSVVEDGVMIQIDTDTMDKLKESLKSMKPFRIECMKPLMVGLTTSSNNTSAAESTIIIEWVKEDLHVNREVVSIVDGMSFAGIKSLNLNNTYDYVNESRAIRWIQIYLIHVEDDTNAIADQNFNLNRFADLCSQACCTALAPLLDDLASLQHQHLAKSDQANVHQDSEPAPEGACALGNKPEAEAQSSSPKSVDPFPVALRIQVSKDQVGYLIGMNGVQITDEQFSARLDNELIQLLNHAAQFSISISFELVFFVQERFNCTNQFLRAKHQN